MTDDIPNIPDDVLDELFRAAAKHGRRTAQRLKDKWIARARAVFEPSVRSGCYVCGKHRSITQAHHVIPLSDQYDRGFKDSDWEHVWLCPNHHVIVHLFLSDGGSKLDPGEVRTVLAEMTRDEIETLHALLMRSRRGLPEA